MGLYEQLRGGELAANESNLTGGGHQYFVKFVRGKVGKNKAWTVNDSFTALQ